MRLARTKRSAASGAALAVAAALLPGPAHAAWPGKEGRLAIVVAPEPDRLTEYESRIVSVRPDGSRPILLHYCNVARSSEPCTSPDYGAAAWSPDGRRLAVVVENRIAVVNSDGSGWRLLSPAGSYHRQPAWSADGREIAFIAGEGAGTAAARSHVTIIDADGGAPRRLPATLGARDVAWSSRNQIAYATYGRGSANGVFKIDARGRHRRRLHRGGQPLHLDWSPDGQRLYFSRPLERAAGTWSVDRKGRSRLEARGIYGALLSPTGRRFAQAGDDIMLSRLDGSRMRAVRADLPDEWDGFVKVQAWQATPRRAATR